MERDGQEAVNVCNMALSVYIVGVVHHVDGNGVITSMVKPLQDSNAVFTGHDEHALLIIWRANIDIGDGSALVLSVH